MAIATLVETVGGASSNTYATQADGDQWDFNRPAANTDWSGATSDGKDAALLFATVMMDSLIEWRGGITTPATQVLLWPRQGLIYRYGLAVPTNVIPQEIKNVQSEFARQLITANRTEDSEIETLGIRRIKAGPVELEFDSDVALKMLPDLVKNLIPKDWYIRITGQSDGYRMLARA